MLDVRMAQRRANGRPARRALATALAAAALTAACGAPAPLPEEELVSEASRYFERGNYTQAIDQYSELLEQHPFSDHAEAASLKTAHAYYLTGQYEKAIAAFSDFERLYPVSPLLPFVEYSVGMCHLDQALAGDRDKTASENAKRQFERLLQRYPSSLYSRLARFRIQQAEEKLAGHELVVGDYYLGTGKYGAAEARYRYILAKYPATASALDANERLAGLARDHEPEAAVEPVAAPEEAEPHDPTKPEEGKPRELPEDVGPATLPGLGEHGF